ERKPSSLSHNYLYFCKLQRNLRFRNRTSQAYVYLVNSGISVYTEIRDYHDLWGTGNDQRKIRSSIAKVFRSASFRDPDQLGAVLQRGWSRLCSLESRIQHALWLLARIHESSESRGDA